MQQIIECVANVSEGRDATVLEALTNAILAVTEARLLDRHTDWDHHRSVFTFGGRPEAVIQAAFELIQIAVPLIDLNTHRGEHPRVGAVDVVPLIPLKGATMRDCSEWAGQLGGRIGADLHIPSPGWDQRTRLTDGHRSLMASGLWSPSAPRHRRGGRRWSSASAHSL